MTKKILDVQLLRNYCNQHQSCFECQYYKNGYRKSFCSIDYIAQSEQTQEMLKLQKELKKEQSMPMCKHCGCGREEHAGDECPGIAPDGNRHRDYLSKTTWEPVITTSTQSSKQTYREFKPDFIMKVEQRLTSPTIPSKVIYFNTLQIIDGVRIIMGYDNGEYFINSKGGKGNIKNLKWEGRKYSAKLSDPNLWFPNSL